MSALIAAGLSEAPDALAFIEREGYRRCDIAACNCNGWHGGHSAARLVEIGDALTEAGVDMNGKTIRMGVSEVLLERDTLRAGLSEAPAPQELGMCGIAMFHGDLGRIYCTREKGHQGDHLASYFPSQRGGDAIKTWPALASPAPTKEPR